MSVNIRQVPGNDPAPKVRNNKGETGRGKGEFVLE